LEQQLAEMEFGRDCGLGCSIGYNWSISISIDDMIRLTVSDFKGVSHLLALTAKLTIVPSLPFSFFFPFDFPYFCFG